ncbi:hypothetical protein E2C01_102758 [Portunus trituberculatus]|uniref:Uncharacterized protein n=1 Tax=Portunus trituberculatus TaxID=210409 RepID=A0A5B7KDF1_PORTR|nr:hypothetical protein [Portunus trituberculatus]
MKNVLFHAKERSLDAIDVRCALVEQTHHITARDGAIHTSTASMHREKYGFDLTPSPYTTINVRQP